MRRLSSIHKYLQNFSDAGGCSSSSGGESLLILGWPHFVPVKTAAAWKFLFAPAIKESKLVHLRPYKAARGAWAESGALEKQFLPLGQFSLMCPCLQGIYGSDDDDNDSPFCHQFLKMRGFHHGPWPCHGIWTISFNSKNVSGFVNNCRIFVVVAARIL